MTLPGLDFIAGAVRHVRRNFLKYVAVPTGGFILTGCAVNDVAVVREVDTVLLRRQQVLLASASASPVGHRAVAQDDGMGGGEPPKYLDGVAPYAITPRKSADSTDDIDIESLVSDVCQRENRFSLAIGPVVSWPELDDANRDIAAARTQVISGLALQGITVSGLEKFMDWDEILKVSLSAEIGYKLFEIGHERPWEIWAEAGYSWSKGDVLTDDRCTFSMNHPIFGPIVDSNARVRFQQIYETNVVNANLRVVPPYRVLGFQSDLEAGLLYLHLQSDTQLDVHSRVFELDNNVRARFSQGGFGYFVGAGLGKTMTFPKGHWIMDEGDELTIYGQAKYQWIKLEGDAIVNDPMVGRYRQPTTVNFDGPFAVIGVKLETDNVLLAPVKLPIYLVGEPVRKGLGLIRAGYEGVFKN